MFALSSDGTVAIGRFQRSSGRATVEPSARVEHLQTSLMVSDLPSVFSDYHSRAKRLAVLQACKRAESIRRASVKRALSALCALLPPSQPTFVLSDHRTMADALEALYADYRQSARECASLMQRAPHDGRPPMAVKVASTVGAMEVRQSERWTQSRVKSSDCRSLHTVPMHRGEAVNAEHEWNAAVDRGIVPTVFASVEREAKRSKSSGRVAPTIRPSAGRIGQASSLPVVLAD